MRSIVRVLFVVASLVAASLVLAVGGPARFASADPLPAVEPFVPVAPTSVLWTPTGIGGARFAANDDRTVQVTGIGGVPVASEVEAVSLQVIAMDSGGAGSLYVDQEGASSVHPRMIVTTAGRTKSITANVAPSAAGEISISADVAMDVGVTVQGWFPKGGGYHALPQSTVVLDTEANIGGGRIAANENRDLVVVGAGGVPAEGVSAVDVRTVTTAPSANGEALRVTPKGISVGYASIAPINNATVDVASSVTGVGIGGAVTFTPTVSTELAVVVDGWFDHSRYMPVQPERVRPQISITPSTPRTVQVAGVGGVPTSGVSSVALSVKTSGASGPGLGQVTVQAGSDPARVATAFRSSPNARQSGIVWTPLAPDGSVQVQVAGDPSLSASVIVDVVGWSASSTAPTETVNPTGTFATPTPGATIDGTATGSVRVAIQASDGGSGIANVTVEVGGQQYETTREVFGTVYRWMADAPALAAGTQAYKAHITDFAGNTFIKTVTYQVQVPAPEDPLATPDYAPVDPQQLDAIAVTETSLTFEGDRRSAVKVGQVLGSDPTTLAPLGYLRKVENVALVDGDTLVSTRQAMLTEAVRRLSIDEVLPAQGGSSRSTNALDLDIEVGEEFSQEFSVVLPNSSAPAKIEGSITAYGRVSIAVKLDIGTDFSSGIPVTVNEFETRLAASAGIDLSIVGEAGVETSEKLPMSGDVQFAAIPTPLPGLWLTPQAELNAEVSASLSGRIEATMSTGKRFEVGARYADGDWEFIEPTHSTIAGPAGIKRSGAVGFDASFTVSPRMSVLVNDAVGPYVEVGVEVSLKGRLSTDEAPICEGAITLHAEVGAELEVPVLGTQLGEASFPLWQPDLDPLGSWACYDGQLASGATQGYGAPGQGEKTLISVSPSGQPANGLSVGPVSSFHSGRIAFTSYATNLLATAPAAAGQGQAYLRRVEAAETSLISQSTAGVAANHGAQVIDMTPDGNRVLFRSSASNLDPAANTVADRLYIRRFDTAETILVTLPTGCVALTFDPFDAMSDDGRFVAFQSNSTSCVPGDTNGKRDVFVHDRVNGTTERVSVGSGGGQLPGDSDIGEISADGRFVTFTTIAPLLEPSVLPQVGSGSLSTFPRTFRHDRSNGSTMVIALAKDGVAEARSPIGVAMDSSGQHVLGADPFSQSTYRDWVLLDLSGSSSSLGERFDWIGWGHFPEISDDARYLGGAGTSSAAFVRDRQQELPETCAMTGHAPTMSGEGRDLVVGSAQWQNSGLNHQVIRCRVV